MFLSYFHLQAQYTHICVYHMYVYILINIGSVVLKPILFSSPSPIRTRRSLDFINNRYVHMYITYIYIYMYINIQMYKFRYVNMYIHENTCI
jgi:hypothetical protein